MCIRDRWKHLLHRGLQVVTVTSIVTIDPGRTRLDRCYGCKLRSHGHRPRYSGLLLRHKELKLLPVKLRLLQLLLLLLLMLLPLLLP